MLWNTVGTHYEMKGIDGNTMGFFWEFGGNTKIPKNKNCLKFNFEIILMNKSEPVPALNLKPEVFISVGLVRPKTVGQKILIWPQNQRVLSFENIP